MPNPRVARYTSWAVRIERAEARGRFTSRDKDYACDWPHCAIGERHGHVPHIPDGEELTFGLLFTDAVIHDDIAKAKSIYAEILALPPIDTTFVDSQRQSAS